MNSKSSRFALGVLVAAGILLGSLFLSLPPGAHSSPADPTQPAFLPVAVREWPQATSTLPSTPSTGRLLVSEVVFDPAGNEPAGEWIELYNAGGGAIDLTYYKVGDAAHSADHEGMMQFPPGAVIASGQVIVIANRATEFYNQFGFLPDFELTESDPGVPNLSKYYSYPLELTNSGDEILVLDGGDAIVDGLSWGASNVILDPPAPVVAAGRSLERSPASADTDTAADWRNQEFPAPGLVDLTPPTPQPTASPTATGTPTASPTPTFGPSPTSTGTPTSTLTPTPFGGRLLLSEVMANPSGSEPAAEWIELYNADSFAIELDNFKIGDAQTPGANEGMYRFPLGAAITPGQVIVVANQSEVFEAAHGFKPDFELVESDAAVPNLTKYSAWATGSVQLTNSGDEVLLVDGGDRVIDGISWGSSTWAFDPSAPVAAEDHSLERYPPGEDTDTAGDWRDQEIPSPGEVDLTPPTETPTPTGTATATATPTETGTPTPLPPLVINEIHADPDSVNGDANGDGDIGQFDDEFVELVNTTAVDISIGGWTLRDSVTTRHIFTQTAIVPAGCAIVIFGGGDPTGTFGGSVVVTATTGSLTLNNSGDTVGLFDEMDTSVISYTYGSEGGDNQSLTRDPDLSGDFVKHSTASGSDGALFSPGTKVTGAGFSGCVRAQGAASPPGAPRWLWWMGSGLVMTGLLIRKRR